MSQQRYDHRADHGKRLTGRRGVGQRKRRLARTNGLCEMCQAKGVTRIADVVDHIVPIAKGGEDTDQNTRNICDAHHDQVTAEQFGRRHRPTIGADGWPI